MSYNGIELMPRAVQRRSGTPHQDAVQSKRTATVHPYNHSLGRALSAMAGRARRFKPYPLGAQRSAPIPIALDRLTPIERRVIEQAAERDRCPYEALFRSHTDVWPGRSKIAAEWLEGASIIADIGCGSAMLLRKFLPRTRYVGVDIAPRDAETIVLDLNKQQLPQLGTETAAVLGVLEYLFDPMPTLLALRQFERVVVTYNHTGLHETRLSRFSHYWVNHLSRKQFELMLGVAGLKISEKRRLRAGEMAYSLERR